MQRYKTRRVSVPWSGPRRRLKGKVMLFLKEKATFTTRRYWKLSPSNNQAVEIVVAKFCSPRKKQALWEISCSRANVLFEANSSADVDPEVVRTSRTSACVLVQSVQSRTQCSLNHVQDVSVHQTLIPSPTRRFHNVEVQ